MRQRQAKLEEDVVNQDLPACAPNADRRREPSRRRTRYISTFGAAAAVFALVLLAALAPRLLAATRSDTARSGDAGSGSWVSQQPVSGRVTSDGSRVYATTDENQVVALDAATGVTVWSTSTTTDDPTLSGPTVTAGVVAVALTQEGAVRGLDAATGAVVWQTKLGSIVRGWAPGSDSNMVYVTTSNPDQVVALTATTGAVAWSTPIDGATPGVPVVNAGHVYVATTSLYCFDATSGQLLWSQPLPDSESDNPRDVAGAAAADAHGVYVTGRDGYVRAFSAADGTQEWISRVGNGSTADTSAADGLVFAVSDAGELHALDATSGQDRWTQQLSLSNASSARAAAGMIIAGADGYLRVFSSADGSIMETLPESNACTISQPPTVLAGAVYFSGCHLQMTTLPGGAR